MLPLILIALGLVVPSQVAATGLGAGNVEDRVVFYLHGKIVEDQGPNAESDRFGRYEYDAILRGLRRNGDTVISEVRKPKTDAWEYARKIANEIEELKRAGLPARRITVVGASKGATIAVLISDLLADREINYVLLAICNPQVLEYWRSLEVCVAGHVLSIYESPDELGGSCAPLASRCSAGIVEFKEIELQLGVGHGIAYRPFDEWVAPTLEWSMNGDEIEYGPMAQVPAPEYSLFLVLADGRRIDAVWEWNDETGAGFFVLKEAVGTEQERPFALEAGDILEATVHYLPSSEEPYSSMSVELYKLRKPTQPGAQGAVIETMARSEVYLLPREAGQPVVSEPFRVTVPTDLDADVRLLRRGWTLDLTFSPGVSPNLALGLSINFPDRQGSSRDPPPSPR